MSAASVRTAWQRRALVGVLGLVALTPLFGWMSGKVEYAEPLDNAAALADATSYAAPTTLSFLPGYSVPGVGGHLGTLGAALFGTVLTLGVSICAARLLAVEN